MKNILIFLILIFTFGFTFFGDNYKELHDKNGFIMIPTSDVKNEKATFYKYNYKGKNIKFFLLKTKDGKIRAAFDACDVCYPAKKGYSQTNDFMICNNCGMKFHISRIGDFRGGCNPSPLKFNLEKDYIKISVTELATHYNYF